MAFLCFFLEGSDSASGCGPETFHLTVFLGAFRGVPGAVDAGLRVPSESPALSLELERMDFKTGCGCDEASCEDGDDSREGWLSDVCCSCWGSEEGDSEGAVRGGDGGAWETEGSSRSMM